MSADVLIPHPYQPSVVKGRYCLECFALPDDPCFAEHHAETCTQGDTDNGRDKLAERLRIADRRVVEGSWESLADAILANGSVFRDAADIAMDAGELERLRTAAHAVAEWASSEHKDGNVTVPANRMRTFRAALEPSPVPAEGARE
jgi:hypothetical protein